jgi:hypothetical protein
MTETKKWYESKTVWGGIISGLALIALAITNFMDIDIMPILETIVIIGGLFGVPIVIHGRKRATKQLR